MPVATLGLPPTPPAVIMQAVEQKATAFWDRMGVPDNRCGGRYNETFVSLKSPLQGQVPVLSNEPFTTACTMQISDQIDYRNDLVFLCVVVTHERGHELLQQHAEQGIMRPTLDDQSTPECDTLRPRKVTLRISVRGGKFDSAR